MFYKHGHNGVVIYKSTLLDHVPHGFSTRVGGVSEEAHLSSLNLGFGKESDANVRENRRRFAVACGVGEEHHIGDVFTSAREQIHTDIVNYVTEDTAAEDYVCDGFYTDRVGVTVAVKTADCVPILLASDDGDVVAAVHAGWRGTAYGIAAVAVERMRLLGVDVGKVRAAIGPSISPRRFRVGDDFSGQLYENMKRSRVSAVADSADELSRSFILPYADGAHCDLWELNRKILTLVGVRDENVDVSHICTYENEELFYSHRRTGAQRGVMASLIAPKFV